MTNNIKSTQGKDSVEAGFASAPLSPARWVQVPLIPYEGVALRADLHWLAPQRLGMVSLDVKDLLTTELIAHQVAPGIPTYSVDQLLARFERMAHQVLTELMDPDPF